MVFFNQVQDGDLYQAPDGRLWRKMGKRWMPYNIKDAPYRTSIYIARLAPKPKKHKPKKISPKVFKTNPEFGAW